LMFRILHARRGLSSSSDHAQRSAPALADAQCQPKRGALNLAGALRVLHRCCANCGWCRTTCGKRRDGRILRQEERPAPTGTSPELVAVPFRGATSPYVAPDPILPLSRLWMVWRPQRDLNPPSRANRLRTNRGQINSKWRNRAGLLTGRVDRARHPLDTPGTLRQTLRVAPVLRRPAKSMQHLRNCSASVRC
jgi:hypothetical protein